MVYSKYDGNNWGVSTCLSDNRYRKEENNDRSEKDICWEKKDEFAERYEDQDAILRKSIQIS